MLIEHIVTLEKIKRIQEEKKEVWLIQEQKGNATSNATESKDNANRKNAALNVVDLKNELWPICNRKNKICCRDIE